MPYLGKSPSFGVRQRYQYTATASQTTFSGTDTANLTLNYTDNNFVDVYQNGVLLKGGGNDYTATSGTSVVLGTGATADDVIEIIVYDAFSAANFYSRTDSDSRYLNVAGDTMTGSLDLNGTELVLDVDGDSSITSDTDDQIDIKIAGADDFAFKANTFEVQTGSNIDMNGTELILDADGDTSITADTDDQIDIKIAGSDSLRIKANEIENVSGDLLIDTAGSTIIDSDGDGEVVLKDGGTQYGQFFRDGDHLKIVAGVQDGDIVFRGNDGGSGVDAAFFDMSDAGTFRTGSMGSANPGAGSHGTIIINGDGGVLITGNSSGNTQALRIYSSTSGSPTATITALGALAKTSGSFKIDHPLESKKDTHYLVHSFIEGPQADLIYRGKITLSAGTATVNVDTATGMTEGTFVALNRETQCFTTNETGWTAIKGSISGNTLTITAQDNSCTDTISWMVIGERHDPHMKDSGTDWTDSDGKVILEPEKESE